MARVHHVASSRTPHTCKAGHVIEPPEGYAWAAPGFRAPKRFACHRHPFRPSELTTGEHASLLAAAEDATAALRSLDEHSTAEDIETQVEDVRSAAQELLDTREEALGAWENGNGQLEELRDAAQEAVNAVDQWQPDTYDGEDGPEDHPDDGTDWEPSEEYREWFEGQVEAAVEAIEEAAGQF